MIKSKNIQPFNRQKKIRKQKTQKSVSGKGKLKFEDYKNCLEATQLENGIKQLEKNKVNVDNFKKIMKNS